MTYEARRTTKIDLVGTPLMPRTRGEAEIKTESAGPVWIKAKVRGLTSPSQLGPEYLTFVLWAIPPQGRAKNLGEIRLDEDERRIDVRFADLERLSYADFCGLHCCLPWPRKQYSLAGERTGNAVKT